MTIAFIADIHGNSYALEAVLDDINRKSVDAIVFLGDLATLGPQPKEVIQQIKNLECPCVTGNHEQALLEPSRISEFSIPAHLFDTLDWCRARLDPSDYEFFRSFDSTIRLPLGPMYDALCYHGAPTSTITQILPDASNGEIDGLVANEIAADLFVGGHTHVAMLRRHLRFKVLNPGSVGCAFRYPFTAGAPPKLMPAAEYALVDCDEIGVSTTLRSVPYDLAGYVKTLEKSSLPLKRWWLDSLS